MQRTDVTGRLEVTFCKSLHKVAFGKTPNEIDYIRGVSPGGAIFHVDCLQSYDLAKNQLVLTSDFTHSIIKGKTTKCVVFKSKKNKNAPKMWVRIDLIARIKDLATGAILYPPQAQRSR